MQIFYLVLEHLGKLDLCSVKDASQRGRRYAVVQQHKNLMYLFYKLKIKKG